MVWHHYVAQAQKSAVHFGYAKIESFAAFIAAVVIVVLGVFIVNFIIRNSGSIKYNKITL